MKRRRVIFQHCIQKLEHTLLTLITVRQTKSFLCDSRPHLCKCCHGLRHYIKFGRLPPLLYIATKRGVYKCVF